MRLQQDHGEAAEVSTIQYQHTSATSRTVDGMSGSKARMMKKVGTKRWRFSSARSLFVVKRLPLPSGAPTASLFTSNSVQCFPPHMLNKPFKAHRNTTSYQRIPIMDFQEADFGYVSDVLHVASHLTVKRELTSNHICYM